MREGCPAEAHWAKADWRSSLKFVYLIESEVEGRHVYTGVTDDIEARLKLHNSGSVAHTSKYRPWRLRT